MQVAKDAREGVAMAQEVQRSGKANATMDLWIKASLEAAALEARGVAAASR